MAADFVIVQGDTEPLLADKLTYANKELVDLEGATVVLNLRSLTAREPVALTGEVGIVSALKGEVSYAFSAADTAVPGNYMANWTVRFPSGKQMTFPTIGYMWVQVQENLVTPGGVQLVGLPEVKDHLFLPAFDRTHDETLTRMIEAVGPLIEDQTGPIIPKVYDEWYEGGHSTISLRHKPAYGYGTEPVLNLLAVSEYRGPSEYTLSIVPTPTQGSVYSVMLNAELGTIVRRTSGGGTYAFWSDSSHPQQSVHVVYESGQKSTPANVGRAALETIRWWFETTQAVGKGNLTQADAEMARPMVALPYHAVAMLAPSKRYPSLA
jgi:hypothetical protein